MIFLLPRLLRLAFAPCKPHLGIDDYYDCASWWLSLGPRRGSGTIIEPRVLDRVKSPCFKDTVNRRSISPFAGDKSGGALWQSEQAQSRKSVSVQSHLRGRRLNNTSIERKDTSWI